MESQFFVEVFKSFLGVFAGGIITLIVSNTTNRKQKLNDVKYLLYIKLSEAFTKSINIYREVGAIEEELHDSFGNEKKIMEVFKKIEKAILNNYKIIETLNLEMKSNVYLVGDLQEKFDELQIAAENIPIFSDDVSSVDEIMEIYIAYFDEMTIQLGEFYTSAQEYLLNDLYGFWQRRKSKKILKKLFMGNKRMRSLKKNQQPFYYATYSEEIEVYKRDENGNIMYIEVDGVLEPVKLGTVAGYNKPVLFNANISAGRGSAEEEVFGSNLDFTRVISTSDMNCPIDVLTRIWIDNEVKYKADGTVNGDSADYKVAAEPAKSLNNIMIAIKKLPQK